MAPVLIAPEGLGELDESAAEMEVVENVRETEANELDWIASVGVKVDKCVLVTVDKLGDGLVEESVELVLDVVEDSVEEELEVGVLDDVGVVELELEDEEVVCELELLLWELVVVLSVG